MAECHRSKLEPSGGRFGFIYGQQHLLECSQRIRMHELADRRHSLRLQDFEVGSCYGLERGVLCARTRAAQADNSDDYCKCLSVSHSRLLEFELAITCCLPQVTLRVARRLATSGRVRSVARQG